MLMNLPVHALWLLVWAFSSAASANCVIGLPHPTFYVGSDAKCKYSTIQAAISDVPSPTSCAPIIYVTNEHAPWTETVTIDNRSLTLIGLAGGCGVSSTGGAAGTEPDSPATTPTTPQATISGAGHAGTSVITITGNSAVTLQYLDIADGNGNDFGSHGGGVYFNGTGSLTLDTDTIEGNYAFFGGGVYMTGTDTNNVYSSLYLNDNVLIIHNTAQYSGGGVFMEGESNMYMTGQSSTISFNHALGVNPQDNAKTEGYGGGIRVVGAATGLSAGVNISSPTGLVGAVSNNTAVYGGGIAVDGGPGDYGSSGFVSIYSTDADHPVEINANTASSAGGAIYLQNHYTAGISQNISYAAACLFDFRVESNTAPEGAAFYLSSDDSLGSDNGTQLGLNAVVGDTFGEHAYATPCTSRPGQVACTPGLQCNDLSDNHAVDSTGNADGSIVFVGTGSTTIADKFVLRGNSGGEMIHFNGHGDVAGGAGTGLDNNGLLSRCLVVDNTVTGNLIYSDDGSNWSMQSCTLANNSIPGGTRGIRADSGITLTNTILYQPGSINFDYSGSSDDLVTNYILTNDRTGYVHQSTVAQGDPLFYDPSAINIDDRNYHLLAFEQGGTVTRSLAVDFAPSAGSSDLSGNPYDQDIPPVSNIDGPRDLGAYEMQPIADRLFADGFGDAISLVK